MTALVGILCDGCGKHYVRETVVQASIGPVRSEAKADGWRTQRGTFTDDNAQTYGYTRDLCPACV